MTETDAQAAQPERRRHEAQLVHRMYQLEIENGRLRRLTLGTLVVVALLLGVSAAIVVVAARHGMPGFVPAVVESREFVLRDREGRVRGAWGEDDQGAIRLVLQDHASATSIKINLLEDRSAGLTIVDSAGNARVVLAMLPDEVANLVFADRRGLTRAVLNLSPSGASTLLFADEGGNTRSGMGLDARGRAMLMAESGTGAEGESADTAQPPPEPRRRP